MLTSGQVQALEDLAAVAAEGGPRVVFTGEPDGGGNLPLDLVVDCRDAPNSPGGIRLRPRERLRIYLPPSFPLDLPVTTTPHRRWAQTPHVQWGRSLCLYRSPAIEWNPGDGIYGYLDRLIDWLDRASAGVLDDRGQPIHPPVAYPSSDSSIVVRADAPRARGEHWLGIALLRQRTTTRWELTEWVPLSGDRIGAIVAARDSGAPLTIAAAALVLPEPIGFEYPTHGGQLYLELRRQNVFSFSLLTAMGLAARLNAIGTGDASAPIFVMLGAPGRGVVGDDLATHVVAWQVEADAAPLLDAVSKVKQDSDGEEAQETAEKIYDDARQWLIDARLRWTRIHEMRTETTVRRDRGTSSSWVRGRRVLVLGAGALGAPTAEACVRAGAAAVAVVDRALVHPGILVRQPYFDDDIDRPKAQALASRLARIDPAVDVLGICADAVQTIGDAAIVSQYDLVIDATADRTVRHTIELNRRNRPEAWPPLLTLMIGHDASRGVVSMNPRSQPNGAVDLLRRLGHTARARDDLRDVAADFYPDPPRTDLFQPEPGCSDATFVGSYADVRALAGQMLVAGFDTLSADRLEPEATIVRMPATGGGSTTVRWGRDQVLDDPATGYQIRISATAVAQMHAETRRGLRVRGRTVETGGMLLGQTDDATRVVWVDVATGPPPDSVLSADYFQHGTAGVEELRAIHRTATARSSDFVGYWHIHPDGPAAPSPTDRHGMSTLVDLVPGCRRALMLILGGSPAQWDTWIDRAELPATFARLVRRGEEMPAAASSVGGAVRNAAIGRTWPGGYSQPDDATHPTGRWASLVQWITR